MSNEFTTEQQKILLQLAHEVIVRGIQTKDQLTVKIENYDAKLQQISASFVTLQKNGELRGCIGSLKATQALVQDVAKNAFSAAFRDPRFSPVSADEMPLVKIHISVLNPAEPMNINSELDLISQLRPGVDGLIIQDHYHRATFLPSVWESLPDATEFVRHLKHKAGFTSHYWSPQIQAFRYTVTSIKE